MRRRRPWSIALPNWHYAPFYKGIYQAEIDGALWTFETIEHARCLPEDVPRDLKRVVVSVDPSGNRGDEDQRSDNVGIVAVGLGIDNTAYVLADRTCNLPPEAWARVAVTAYREFKADRIVAEQNFGGDMVRAVLHTVDRNVPVHLVNASRGKTVRAEPVWRSTAMSPRKLAQRPGAPRGRFCDSRIRC